MCVLVIILLHGYNTSYDENGQASLAGKKYGQGQRVPAGFGAGYEALDF